MLRLAWKSIKHNPKRLLLTTAAVVLGVAFVSAIHTFTNALDNKFASLFDTIYEGDGIYIGDPTSFEFGVPNPEGFPESVLDTVLSVPGVASATAGVQAAVVILDAEGDLPTAGGAPTLLFNWTGDVDTSGVTVIEGVAPSQPGQLVMTEMGAEKAGYEVGDTVTIAADTGLIEFELVGITDFRDGGSLLGATLIHASLDDVQAIAHREGEYTTIVAYTEPGANGADVTAAIQAALPDELFAKQASTVNEESIAEFRKNLEFVDIFTLAFAIIALFVGSFIIANTFRIIVTQRTREIGLLRALGARSSQIRSQVLLEALLVGIIASVIGIGLGYLLALALNLGVASQLGGSAGTPSLPLDAVIWGLGVGLIVTLVSALLPALHASSIAPMEALRESATQSRKPLTRRNQVGGALSIAALAVLGAGLWAGVPNPAAWIGVGAMVLILGVTLLAAQVLVPLADALRGWLGKLFGVTGKLAASNVRREPRRAATTAAALMVGVMLLALVATVTESTKAVAREQLVGQTSADLLVGPDLASGQGTGMSLEALAAVKATDGVDIASALALSTRATVEGNAITLGVLETDTAALTYNYDSTPSISELDEGEAYINGKMVDLGYAVGDTIVVEGPDGAESVLVTGLYNIEGDADVFVDWNTGLAIDDELEIFFAYVTLDEGADIDTVTAALEATIEQWPLLAVNTPEGLTKLLFGFIDFFLAIISVMLSAALVIAILGVANTLFLSVTERTREIGLLRAVGLRRKQIRSMITLESVAIAVFGTVLGIVLGVGIGSALVISLEEYGFGTPSIPWVWMAIYAVLAILAGILAAIWPARRASKLDILAAIASE